MKIERHRTAIQRNQLSRPVLVALRDGVLSAQRSFFDYGCGRGQDLEYLLEMGIRATGWDPTHAPDAAKTKADVVNLGYVINVIEDPIERKQVLKEAYDFAHKVLVVSAMVGFKERALRNTRVLNDGVVTQRGTFQRYYDQAELGEYITETLKREVYPAAQGVYYVFACDVAESEYCNALANEGLEIGATRLPDSVPMNSQLLSQLGEKVLQLRRLPLPSEMPELGVVLGVLASSDDWLQPLAGVISEEERKSIRQERRSEVVRILATGFYSPEGGRRMSDLSLIQRSDVRLVFGSMARAEVEVERYLRKLLVPEKLESDCKEWGLGKLTPSARYLHSSLETVLPKELSLLIDCARTLAAENLDGSENILKVNYRKPGVSFASYPGFELVPHPELRKAVRVDFASSTVANRDYSQSTSPPILHRKELFVAADHPSFQSWSDFTLQEEALGLLGRRDIGTKGSWSRVLAAHGVVIDADKLTVGEPYSIESEIEDEPFPADEDFEVSLGSAKRKVGKTKVPKVRWSESELEILSQCVANYGRLPQPDEVPLDDNLVKRFLRVQDWESLLGDRFDPDAFEQKQRSRWKHWVVYLAATRFGGTGRPKLKQLDSSAKADMKAFFQSYRLACAEADHWLMKIGDPDEINNAIQTHPYGLHHSEKGLYLHKSLQEDLPVVLQLLLLCARFMAGRSMLQEVTVARITPDGKNVKFYEYKDFEKPGAATRVQSVKVDFRRRKVIPRDYFHPPKMIWERAEMIDHLHPSYPSLLEFEDELRKSLLNANSPH